MHVFIYGSELSAVTAAAALAQVGHRVHWMPHRDQPWPVLEASLWLTREPWLHAYLTQAMEDGSLQLECDPLGAAEDRLVLPEPLDIIWLSLSPLQRDDAACLLRSARDASSQARPYQADSPMTATDEQALLVINNSTFPVGETQRMQDILGSTSVCLPDMLEEGRAWQTFTRPARWLLGCDNGAAERRMRELLRAFNRREDVIQNMPRRAAELTKLAINGMLATRISYMNEMAGLADTLGVDVEHVRLGMGADPRIGDEYLYPGCGFGGPNFSRDLMRLADAQLASGRESALLEHVMDINEQKKETLFRKLWNHFQGNLEHRTVAIWGAAFKPGTARIDHAPVLTLIDALLSNGVRVQLHDPAATPALTEQLGPREGLATCHQDPYEACQGADALMLVTEWKLYWNPDWQRLSRLLSAGLILDGRNIYDPNYVASCGLAYRGIGRRADPPA